MGTGKSVQSQSFAGKLILGFNGSQIDGDGLGGYYKPGLVFGAGVRFPLNEKLSIGPEIMYSMKGAKTSFDQVTKYGYPRIIYRLNYVDLPVIAEYKVNDGLQIEGGLSVNYMLNAKLDPGGNIGFQDAEYLFNKLDYQAIIGLKYYIFDDCWLSGRWLYSVVSNNKIGITTANYSFIGAPTRGGFFNNLLQFSLTYRLFGGKPSE
jgi:hypothetical protein